MKSLQVNKPKAMATRMEVHPLKVVASCKVSHGQRCHTNGQRQILIRNKQKEMWELLEMLDRGIPSQRTASIASSFHQVNPLNEILKQPTGNMICASKRKISCDHSNLEMSTHQLK